MTGLKQAMHLYRENFRWILLTGITIVVPVQIVFAILINSLSAPFEALNIPLWSQMFESFFMLIAVFLVQPVSLSMVVQDARFEEVRIGRIYGDAIQFMASAYFLGIIYAFVVTVGMMLFLIPGLLLLVWFSAIPCAIVLDGEKGWNAVKRTFSFGRSYFWEISGVMIFYGVVDFVFSTVAYILAYLTTPYLAGINLAFMIVNLLILPLFTLHLGFLYMDWKADGDRVYQRVRNKGWAKG